MGQGMSLKTRQRSDGRTWRTTPVFVLLLADFVLLGLAVGTQGVLWADVVKALHVSDSAFGNAQLVAPLVSVALLLVGGQLSAWAGKKRLAIASLALFAASAVALAAMTSLWGLVGALVLLGAGNGFFETAMNGAALDWEQAVGRSVLNLMHAGYSGGAVVGALGAGTLRGLGWQPSGLFALLALLGACMLVATLPVRYPPADAREAETERPSATLRLLVSRRALIALALLCVLGAVGESVANLWSVISLRDRGAGVVLGGGAFALFNSAMFLGRLANAPLVARVGGRFSLQASGVGLVLATILLLIPGGVALAVAAFMLVGLSVAGVIPTVLTEGARLAPGQSGAVAGGLLAAVYLSYVLWPPLIGALAERFSLQAALAVIGLSGAAVLLLARGVERDSADARYTARPPG
jgi:fucose permease